MVAIYEALLGRDDEARAALDIALPHAEVDRYFGTAAYQAETIVHLEAGRLDEAVASVERELFTPGMLRPTRNHLKTNPVYAPLRELPRFKALVAGVGSDIR